MTQNFIKYTRKEREEEDHEGDTNTITLLITGVKGLRETSKERSKKRSNKSNLLEIVRLRFKRLIKKTVKLR